VVASIYIERKLCVAPAKAGDVNTLGADYFREGIAVVNWILPWSSGGSTSWHPSRSLVAGPFDGALDLSVRCCALAVRS
jgi:hypothetical protein